MSTERDTRSPRFSRREAIGLLGVSAGLGLASAWKADAAWLMDWQTATSAKKLQLPRGAIIRTILKDVKPEELAGGATLFHEHMSLAEDFLPRWVQYQRAVGPGRHDGRDQRRDALP